MARLTKAEREELERQRVMQDAWALSERLQEEERLRRELETAEAAVRTAASPFTGYEFLNVQSGSSNVPSLEFNREEFERSRGPLSPVNTVLADLARLGVSGATSLIGSVADAVVPDPNAVAFARGTTDEYSPANAVENIKDAALRVPGFVDSVLGWAESVNPDNPYKLSETTPWQVLQAITDRAVQDRETEGARLVVERAAAGQPSLEELRANQAFAGVPFNQAADTLHGVAQRVGGEVSEEGRAASQALVESAQDNPFALAKQLASPQGVRGLANVVVESLPYAGAGRVFSSVTRSSGAAGAGVSYLAASQNAQQQRDAIRDMSDEEALNNPSIAALMQNAPGLTVEQAKERLASQAGFAALSSLPFTAPVAGLGVFEQAGTSALRARALQTLGGRAGRGLVREAGTELVEETTEALAEQRAEVSTGRRDQSEFGQGAIGQGAIGALAGGITGAGSETASARADFRNREQLLNAVADRVEQRTAERAAAREELEQAQFEEEAMGRLAAQDAAREWLRMPGQPVGENAGRPMESFEAWAERESAPFREAEQDQAAFISMPTTMASDRALDNSLREGPRWSGMDTPLPGTSAQRRAENERLAASLMREQAEVDQDMEAWEQEREQRLAQEAELESQTEEARQFDRAQSEQDLNTAKSRHAAARKAALRDVQRANANRPEAERLEAIRQAAVEWDIANPAPTAQQAAAEAQQRAPRQRGGAGRTAAPAAPQLDADTLRAAGMTEEEIAQQQTESTDAPTDVSDRIAALRNRAGAGRRMAGEAADSSRSPAEVIRAIAKRVGRGTDRRALAQEQLLLSGKLSIVSDEDMTQLAGGQSNGFYDGERMYINAGAVPAGKEAATILDLILTHEADHAARASGNADAASKVRMLLGDGATDRLVQRLETDSHPIAQDARNSVERLGLDESPDRAEYEDELIAYAITSAVRRGTQGGVWAPIRGVVSAARRKWKDYTGSEDINLDDLAAYAQQTVDALAESRGDISAQGSSTETGVDFTGEAIEASGGSVLPPEEVFDDGFLSPWLMADGTVVQTNGDHITAFTEDSDRNYGDYMRRTGAVRMAAFRDVDRGNVMMLHTYPGQSFTAQQIAALSTIRDVNGNFTLMHGEQDRTNPEYSPATIETLPTLGRAQIAFHGTPSTFAPEEGAPLGRFRSSRASTGVGGQVYGAGHYFTQQHDTADSRYRERLVGSSVDPAWNTAKLALDDNDNDIVAARASMAQSVADFPSLQPALDILNENDAQRIQDEVEQQSALDRGEVYYADIPEDNELAHWQQPIEQSSQQVQDAILSIDPDANISQPFAYWYIGRAGRNMENAAQVSAELAAAGVKGHLFSGRTDGPRNFVIYSDEDVRIVGRDQRESGQDRGSMEQWGEEIVNRPDSSTSMRQQWEEEAKASVEPRFSGRAMRVIDLNERRSQRERTEQLRRNVAAWGTNAPRAASFDADAANAPVANTPYTGGNIPQNSVVVFTNRNSEGGRAVGTVVASSGDSGPTRFVVEFERDGITRTRQVGESEIIEVVNTEASDVRPFGGRAMRLSVTEDVTADGQRRIRDAIRDKTPNVILDAISVYGSGGEGLFDMNQDLENARNSIYQSALAFDARLSKAFDNAAKSRGVSVEELNNTVLKRLEAIGKIPSNTRKDNLIARIVQDYPELHALPEAIQNINAQTDRIINARLADPRPITEKELAQLEYMEANKYSYLTNVYAAFQGKAGKEFRKKLLEKHSIGYKAVLDGKAVPEAVKREYAVYERALSFITANDVAVSDPEMLAALPVEQVRGLYDMWTTLGDSAESVQVDMENNGTYNVDEYRDTLESRIAGWVEAADATTIRNMAGIVLNNLLDNHPLSGPAQRYGRGAGLDESILQHRRDLPPELADLYGKITDIPSLINATLVRQGELAEKMKFLTRLATENNERGRPYVVSQREAASSEFGDYTVPLSGESFGPLSGMMTTPETARMITDYSEGMAMLTDALAIAGQEPSVLRRVASSKLVELWAKGAGLQKAMKIITRPDYLLLNFAGSFSTPVLTGGFTPQDFLKGVQLSAEHLSYTINPSRDKEVSPELRLVLEMGLFDNAVTQEIRNTPRKMVEQVIRQMGSVGSMSDFHSLPSDITGGARRAWNLAVEAYSMSDAWAKIPVGLARMRYLQDYYKANGDNVSNEQIVREAAKFVRDSTIGMQAVPAGLKGLERLGMTFYLPYFYSAFRTLARAPINAWNDAKMAVDAKTPDARNIAARSAALKTAGTAMVYWGLTSVLKNFLEDMMDDDEREQLERDRNLMFPQDAVGDLLPVGEDELGRRMYFVVSRTDQFGPATDIFRALRENDDPDKALGIVAEGLRELFLANRALGWAIDTAKDKDRNTQTERVFDETTNWMKSQAAQLAGNKGVQAVDAVIDAIDLGMPAGVMNYFDPENKKPQDVDGQGRALVAGLMTALGHRFVIIDEGRSLGVAAGELRRHRTDAERNINTTLSSLGPQAAMQELLSAASRERELVENVGKMFHAIVESGTSPREAMQMLNASGMDATTIAAIRKQAYTTEAEAWAKNYSSILSPSSLRNPPRPRESMTPEQRKEWQQEWRRQATEVMRRMRTKSYYETEDGDE